MIWFVVWTVLVVGALALFFVLLRRLWRQAVELGRQLAVASEVVAQLADQVEALRKAAERDPIRPTLFDDPDIAVRRYVEVKAAAEGRREQRAGRLARTIDGWRTYWT